MYITANGITNISKQCFVNLLNANFIANLLRTFRYLVWSVATNV